MVIRILGWVLLAGVSQLALADDAGKALFEARCSACHQANAAGSPALKAPNLAGLSAAYVQRQLEHFRSGLRGAEAGDAEGPMMRAVAATLADGEIAQLAGYVAQLPSVPAPRPPRTAGFAGRGLYSGCTSCHGANAEGFEQLGAPRLAGQYDWYLKAQLQKFRAGLRGVHPEDARGQQMRSMALGIHDEATLDSLVLYIGNLKVE